MDAYYDVALTILDGDAGPLLALAGKLPDEAKKTELLAFHERRTREEAAAAAAGEAEAAAAARAAALAAEAESTCLLYTSPSPRDRQKSRMPSSA